MRGSIALAVAVGLIPALGHAAELTLSWDPNAPEEKVTGYKVYYGTHAGPPYEGVNAEEGASPIDIPLVSLADPNQPSYTLRGLDTCQEFFFTVTAYNEAGESGFSNEVSKTVVPKPKGVTVTPAGGGGVQVSWDGLDPVDLPHLNRVRVHYDLDPGEPYSGTGADQGPSPVVIGPSATEMFLTGLAPAQTVYVVVEPLCPSGAGRMSKESSGLTGESVPSLLQGGCRIARGPVPAPLWPLLLGLLWLRRWSRARR
jgi:hypothetical protein